MAPPQTTILITGANSGIGLALATTYLSRPFHTIICPVRDPTRPACQSLLTLPTGPNSEVILIPYDASNTSSAATALGELAKSHPEIRHIDVVIANAGMASYMGPSLDADPEVYTAHLTTNVLGPIILFKASLPLLLPSSSPPPAKTPTFITISSATGSTTMISQSPLQAVPEGGKRRAGALPYSTSKCALNHAMVRLSLEYPDLKFGLFTPGPTKTRLGGENMNWEQVKGLRSIGEVVPGLVQQFDSLVEDQSERSEAYLQLKDWSGKVFEW